MNSKKIDFEKSFLRGFWKVVLVFVCVKAATLKTYMKTLRSDF